MLVKLAMKTWKMRKQGKACWQIHIFFFKNMSYLISARDSRRKKKTLLAPPKRVESVVVVVPLLGPFNYYYLDR